MVGTIRRHRRWLQAALVIALFGQLAVGLVTAAREQSPTVDEPVYLGAAVSYLQHHDLRLNPEHPPLAKLIVGTGLAFADVRLDPAYQGSQWEVGHQVLYGPGNDADRVLWLGRLPMIVLTLLFGLVVLGFGRDLFGTWGGVLALALYALSPDVIAHGSLATNDVPLAGFLLTTVWLLWRARRRPRRYLPLAGLAFGCALATKMTALPLFPVVLLLAAVAAWTAARPTTGTPADATGTPGDGPDSDGPDNGGPGRWSWWDRRRIRPGLGYALGVGLIALATVWLSYLVIDPTLDYRSVAIFDPGVKKLAVSLLPLPEPYRDGMLLQLGYESRSFSGYLFGERFQGNLWYYLPVAVLIKTPLGMIVLWLGAVAALLAVRRLRPVALYLLLPLGILLPIAMTGARSFGSRYVIWLPVLLAVAAPAVLALRRRWVVPVALLLVASVAVSSLRTYPYYLPYANEAFGGPANSYRLLNDSNVDWGQDLRRLGVHLRENRLADEPVWLIYKGRGEPGYYGIRAADPLAVPPEQVHGLLAISAMRLSASRDGFAELVRGQPPIARIGHTIWLYRIP
ncbi:ArnT family glycosyltransferase [Plantactinospora sonchi]|uniref:Glycosyltransferase family 39 protein n=1 Tax=Plantactinospora sonchi TaxID=1544735 RepID=A0ABU7RZN5_9ACTN